MAGQANGSEAIRILFRRADKENVLDDAHSQIHIVRVSLDTKPFPISKTIIVLLVSLVFVSLINGFTFLIIFHKQAEITRLRRQLTEQEQNRARLEALLRVTPRAAPEAAIETQSRPAQGTWSSRGAAPGVVTMPPTPLSGGPTNRGAGRPTLTRAEAQSRIEAQRRILQEIQNDSVATQGPPTSPSPGQTRSSGGSTNRGRTVPFSLTREEANARIEAYRIGLERYIQNSEPAGK